MLIRDIGFTSHCEHHMMPFYGKAHVAYRPVERVVGLSKLARLVDIYARRLQTQEHLTSQIATAIDEVLKPHGVAVMIEAEHTCMTMRGVQKPGASTVTTRFLGTFRDNPDDQMRFMMLSPQRGEQSADHHYGGIGAGHIIIRSARRDSRSRRRRGADAEIRRRRARHLRRHRRRPRATC